ncbi:acetate--CoA ligase family protein [Sabulicella rubraurantiaca]|uniref:acetate--CoA ligase family protein n=1 Tax=Sabulicella rubraurantiaca TaxID=2811429 RepID=UPI001F292D6C|nr:acetate--CoA ligase family protein [Sabulicella rubraurantiaca]
MKPTDAAERPLHDSASLRPLLDPRSIAIVGASPRPGSFGGNVLVNLRKHYGGTILPINPQYDQIGDLPCFPDIASLPERPDLLGVAVPGAKVEGVLRDAAAAGVAAAVVFSSGFAEIGTAEGGAMQRRISALAAETGIRVLGPNCTGIVQVRSGAACNILPSVRDLPLVPGGVGLVGQSGALGYVVFQAMHRGVGFSRLISTGNSCDVDIADLINFLVDDEDTKVIACLFESVPSGRRLLAALQRAFRAGKPVVACKVGTTAAGSRAALSHSGMLAGDAATYAAVFDRTGVVQVEALEELLETALFFARAGRPSAGGIGILSGSGGSVVMAADKAERHGVAMPQPGEAVVAALRDRLPDFATIANPADITAESIRDETMYTECVRIFAEDPGFASVAVLMPSAHGQAAVTRAQSMEALAANLDKPLSLVWMNEWHEGPGTRIYDASERLAMFRSLDRCMQAYRRWFDGARRRPILEARPEVFPPHPAAAEARKRLSRHAAGASLTERESKAILSLYGLPAVGEVLCRSRDEAMEAAEQIGFPVVAKVEAPLIRHKTDIGGVRLNLRDAASVGEAYDAIMAATAGVPKVEGVVIQRMIPPGVEMLLGARQDPQFGPLVVFGFGGTLVEIMGDVAVRLAPVTPAEVREALDGLRMRPVLDGARGEAPRDIGAFCDMVAALSRLIADQADLVAEIDVNPVILHAEGGIAVDALIVRAG